MYDHLKNLQDLNKLTNKELGEMIGVSEEIYFEKLCGRIEFEFIEMQILSNYFHKTIDFLFVPTSNKLLENQSEESDKF